MTDIFTIVMSVTGVVLITSGTIIVAIKALECYLGRGASDDYQERHDGE